MNALTFLNISLQYIAMKYIATQAIDRELKKGSAELLILSLIEHRARHGYEIGKLIEERSEGVLKYNVASFYPVLYRLEARGLIEGRWVEKAGQRRCRYYKLTTKGKKMLETLALERNRSCRILMGDLTDGRLVAGLKGTTNAAQRSSALRSPPACTRTPC
jgi:PadR family transcriptional regulator, regulatory protein PadR